MKKKLHMHETFTDGSSTVIRIDELTEAINDLSLEEQNNIMINLLELSYKNDAETRKKIKDYQMFYKKRDFTKEKRKVKASKKLKYFQKKYIYEGIHDYQNFIKEIIDLDYDEFEEYIESLNNVKEFSMFLSLGLCKERRMYEKWANDAYIQKDIDLLCELGENISELNDKIDFLKQVTEDEKVDEKLCNLIFFETTSQRAYFLEDILGLNEFYSSFAKIIKSIQKGRPRKLKHFYNDENLRGLLESRDVDGQTRIFFDKINENTYVIINAIIKKDDNSLAYRTQVSNRYKLYLQHKFEILENLNEEGFIERQSNYLNEVERRLGLREDEKQLVKGGK